MVAFPEHKVNYWHKLNLNDFRQMYQRGEADIKAVGAHNAHKNPSTYQERGTGLLAYGVIVSQILTVTTSQWTLQKQK